MSDEDAFQAALDLNPDDATTRLVFADWLDEQGDPRAPGMRALAVWRKYPSLAISFWWANESYDGLLGEELEPVSSRLPEDWFKKIRGAKLLPALYGLQFATRREAEDAAALAFAKLPASRQLELLAQPVLA